jgi:hypothetical protein
MVVPESKQDRIVPLALKWQGVAAILNGDPSAAMAAFRKFSAVSPIGDTYLALTLCVMGRAEEARAILAASPQPLLLVDGLAKDAERVFGKAAVELLRRSRE